jgi:hypothetical protein
LKDFLKKLTTQLVYNQKLLWMITILATLPNKIKKMYIIFLGKRKFLNFTKIGHVLCIENKIVKILMNALLD